MFKRIITYSILTFVTLFGFFGNINLDIVKNNSDIHGVVLSYEGNTTYAAEPCKEGQKSTGTAPCEPPKSTDQVVMYNKMIDSINIALAVLSAMITPIILFVGWLMSPDWTSGDLFGLRAPMHSLWVTVSNIVYFVYAILLILIALGTMFGKDTFSYKTMLPKLALGIIMVPFTWWFVQWTISISSVVTASVMTIPAETMRSGDSTWFTNPTIPKIISVDNTGSGANANVIDCSMYPTECQSPKEFLTKSSGMYGPLIVYGYSVFKFEKITRLDSTLDVASAALKIVHSSIISTLMFAVFGVITFALAVMLLVRAIKLWMYAIFAPLFTFRFVAGSNLMGGDDDSFSIREFIGLAFLPAIVGLTLSFGLIIINAVQGPAGSSQSTKTGQTCDLSSTKGCVIEGIMGNPANSLTRTIENFNTKDAYTRTVFKYADIQFFFLGKATNQSSSISTSSGAIDALGGMFGTLIIDVIALVFIWMAFMAAKNVSKAVKAVAQPFEDIGNKVGGLAKSLPKYAPLPIPGGSISGLAKTGELASNKFEATMKQKELDNIGRFAPGLVEGVIKPKDIEALRNTISDNMNKGDAGAKKIAEEIAKTQGNANFTGGNYETLKQEISGKLNDDQIKYLLKSRSIVGDEAVMMTKFYKGEELDHDKKEKAWKLNKEKFGSGGGKDGGSSTTNNINLNINPTGNEKDIASAIRGSNTEKTITRTDLETALKEKIKKPDGNIDTDKIKKILDEIKDDFFKKPGTSSGGGGGH